MKVELDEMVLKEAIETYGADALRNRLSERDKDA